MKTTQETIDLDPKGEIPCLDVVFSACRSNRDGYSFDLIDCNSKKLSRWSFPIIDVKGAVEDITKNAYPDALPMGYTDPRDFYVDQYMTPHVVQCCPQDKLFVSFGVAENGYCNAVIDMNKNEVTPLAAEGGLKLHSSTGDFDKDFKRWYYCAWPSSNTARDLERSQPNRIEIWSADIESLEQECHLIIEDKAAGEDETGLGLPRKLHQITLSANGRYAIMSPFEYEPNIPYPLVPIEEDPEGYRRSHEGGMKRETVIIADLVKKDYWQILVPVPVPAHLEFDPVEDDVFYASAHNISVSNIGTLLEGPAEIFKMRITTGATEIISSYSAPDLFRITQHSVFQYGDETLVAITCVPNKLVIIKASDMSLWREVEIFEADPIQLSDSGVLSPDYGLTCYSVNPTRDGAHIILENASQFIIYDLGSDRILPQVMERNIPSGMSGRGHTRTFGQ